MARPRKKSMTDVVEQANRLIDMAVASGNNRRAQAIAKIGARYRDNIENYLYKQKHSKAYTHSVRRDADGTVRFEKVYAPRFRTQLQAYEIKTTRNTRMGMNAG